MFDLGEFVNAPPTQEDMEFFGKSRPRARIRKRKTCLLCKRPVKIVDSHTIPQSALNIVAEESILFNAHFFVPTLQNHSVSTPGIDPRVGIANAMVFNLICDSCENIFGYETRYLQEDWAPSQRDLNEIALKNSLYRSWEWHRERNLILSENEPKNRIQEAALEVYRKRAERAPNEDEMDLVRQELYRAVSYKRMSDEELDNVSPYRVIQIEKLKWLAPVVAQSTFMSKYRVLFSPFRRGDKYKHFIHHLAILPNSEGTTSVFIFVEQTHYEAAIHEIGGRFFQWINALPDHDDEGFLFSGNMNPLMYESLLSEINMLTQRNSLSHGRRGSQEIASHFMSRSAYHLLPSEEDIIVESIQ